MKLISRCAAMTTLVAAMVVLLAAEQEPVYLFRPDRFGEKQCHIVLLKIQKAQIDPGDPGPTVFTYQAKVLFDLIGSSLDDKEISVTGKPGGLHVDFIPKLAVGDSVIFVISPTKDPMAFDNQPQVTLPIGMDSSMLIPPGDIPDLLDALKLTKQASPITDLKKSHQDAVKYFESKNYYIFALGAQMLALEGTKENVDRFLRKETEDDCTLNQFVWINEMLDEQTMKNVTPTYDHRIHDYQWYLKKHAPKTLFKP